MFANKMFVNSFVLFTGFVGYNVRSSEIMTSFLKRGLIKNRTFL